METDKPAPARTAAPDALRLTPEQWAGLARLGDLVHHLDGALAGPLGGVVTAQVIRGGDVPARYDVPELAASVLQTVHALHESGLPPLLRDNAALIRETLQVAVPMIAEVITRLQTLSPDRMQAEAQTLLRFARTINRVADFAREQLTPELIRRLVELGEIVQRQQTDAALADLMETVSALHRNGSLRRLRRLSDYVHESLAPLDRDALAQTLLRRWRDSGVQRAFHLVDELEAAAARTEYDGAHLGGISGLFHLLRDPEVQKGLRLLGVLPGYLGETARQGNGTRQTP